MPSVEDTLREYVRGEQSDDVVLSRLNETLREVGKGDASWGFNAEELRWIKAHFDKLPNMLRSRLACAIYLAVDKQRGAYLRQLCRKLGKQAPKNPNAVNYWLKKFFRVELLQRSRTAKGWGNEIYYYAPKLRYPKLVVFVKDLMTERIVEQNEV